jgi:hypothetical protein
MCEPEMTVVIKDAEIAFSGGMSATVGCLLPDWFSHLGIRVKKKAAVLGTARLLLFFQCLLPLPTRSPPGSAGAQTRLPSPKSLTFLSVVPLALKELKIPGDNEIFEVWEDNLAFKVHAILDQNDVDWSSTGNGEKSLFLVTARYVVFPQSLRAQVGESATPQCPSPERTGLPTAPHLY